MFTQSFTGNAWDNKGPKGMKFHSDVMRQDLLDRTKGAGNEYSVSNKPASTAALTVFSRGSAWNANPDHDEPYRSDFPTGTGKKAKGIIYEGELNLTRHRTVGLVNELIDSHISKNPNPTQTQITGHVRPLTVDEQQQKLEDMQRALLEEAAFLDRLKNMESEHPLACSWLTGDKDKSMCGGCIRLHWPLCERDNSS